MKAKKIIEIKEAIRQIFLSKGYVEKRNSFYKETYRFKFLKNSLRLEYRIRIPATKYCPSRIVWKKIKSAYIKDIVIVEGKIRFLKLL